MDAGASTLDRLRAIEQLLEGPPRLGARLERLERIVEANKLTAGEADDAPHRAMGREEAGKAVAVAGLAQDEINQSFAARIAELFNATGLLQSASLRLFTVLVILTGSAVGIALRIIFG